MFLPKDYQVPSSESQYMKFVKGENRFRILSSPILGYEWWVEVDGKRKPKRVPMDAQIHPDDLEGDTPKHFWAMIVFDHKDNKIKILEITQKSIQRTLRGLAQDEDWGDPKGASGYDIVVTRDGEGIDTRYEVTPKPKKNLDEGIIQMYKDTNINLSALYKGEDPFTSDADQIAQDVADALGGNVQA